jgi:hypothetical protein
MSDDSFSTDALPEDALSAYLDDELAESADWRAVLDELRETRDALRALPAIDGSPEFWARVLAPTDAAADPPADRPGGLGDAVVDLGTERRARRLTGWRVAIASVAAAIMIVVVGAALVPQRERVKPAVATFADAHATRSSFDGDPLSSLASVGVPGFNR